MTKRKEDINGFVTIENNPISKVGVFPYLGREIGAPEPEKVYQVYRPEEELNNQDTIKSFNLLPWVDEHEFLGKDGTPAEKKGVQGTTGESAYFEYPYLKNNIRVYSDYMQNLIDKGKIELSPSYRCKYEFTSGVFDGRKYDAIQRDIRGNHLALVKEGRTGKDVAVQDQIITIDSKSIKEQLMFTEEQLAAIQKLIQEALAAQNPVVDQNLKPECDNSETTSKEAGKPAVADEPMGNVTPVTPEAAKAVVEAENAVEMAAEAIEAVKEEIASDSMKKLVKQLSERDALVKRVTPHIGVFDSSSMLSAQDVASYAAKKLNIKAVSGAEIATLDGYLQHVKPPIETVAKDSAPIRGNDTISALWKGNK